ncbi:MAG: UDP-3-O-acyl-N-acetylglucosamine deacetylase [Pseudomonadota bacterium]|nr:UDP-3-O-acyl-N-acetylglucosamine deacetylase [Pseudomonadota bacterium]
MPYDAMQHVSPSVVVPPRLVLGATSHTRQRTLRGPAECSGVGVHLGEKVTLRLLPAPEETGIVFVRTDLKNGARLIPARWDHVVDTRLCTVIGNKAGARVATIEHLMAALHACGIDNAFVEIDRAEVPVMDGSSDPFIFLIEMAGTVEQRAPRKVIEILSTIEVVQRGKIARLAPALESRFSFEIDFNQAPISRQRYEFTLSPETFKSEISRARTFGFYEEVDALRKQGFARGGSLKNAIVIKDEQVMNEGGLRYADEFVRHKLLDAVGDLSLAGASIRGHFEGYCSGHALNNQLLHALFADPSAWRMAATDDTATDDAATDDAA